MAGELAFINTPVKVPRDSDASPNNKRQHFLFFRALLPDLDKTLHNPPHPGPRDAGATGDSARTQHQPFLLDKFP